MTSTPAVKDQLGFKDWPEPERERGRLAATLATTIYAGHVRDQGTPYINHPVRVVTILKNELGVTDPELLILGLLHDALEISPSAEPLIASRLGPALTQRLRSMTPDHRLEQRPKQPQDSDVWHSKIRSLGPEELLVRLADRIDNLRDLRHSPDPDRRTRFLNSLTSTYLPLAEESRVASAPLRAAYEVLHTEYQQQTEADR
ncbi:MULTISPECIES: HD domain-containing protein [Streptomyces]|uniref:HD domain-containing protein n=2 Tax=Streptomyces TaxID=1883 RepID=A0ABU2U324_9ACTN|nr:MULTISPECIES: HD domain-containing protein [Streptomyces]MDT0467629.1 HD domain-containing protein [Streptomyces sp. DSM 41699]UXY23370.1 HD domain-containing protein [Streptomyces cynarae]